MFALYCGVGSIVFSVLDFCCCYVYGVYNQRDAGRILASPCSKFFPYLFRHVERGVSVFCSQGCEKDLAIADVWLSAAGLKV